jgi:hypothetical protein
MAIGVAFAHLLTTQSLLQRMSSFFESAVIGGGTTYLTGSAFQLHLKSRAMVNRTLKKVLDYLEQFETLPDPFYKPLPTPRSLFLSWLRLARQNLLNLTTRRRRQKAQRRSISASGSQGIGAGPTRRRMLKSRGANDSL